VLRAGDVELDCVARLARRGGRPLALSAKELALLEALIATSPGYLSAEQLLERVWDEHADPFTKTVTVTISRLRRKVGEPQMIETAIGVGYRVAAEVASDEAVLQEHDAAVVDELAQRRARRDRGPEAMTRDLLVLETARVKVLRDPA
jgi:DNA-binding winged helix-turn-helix (wHTH) protein